MELVLLEIPLVTLAVVKVLDTLAVKHAILPTALVLFGSSLAVEDSLTALDAVLELTFIPAAVCPPERTAAVSLTRLELTLVYIRLLPRPPIHSAALLLVKLELPNVVVPSGKVQLSMALELAVDELAGDDFVGVLEETDTLAVRTIDFGLADVDDLGVLVEFGVIELGVQA